MRDVLISPRATYLQRLRLFLLAKGCCFRHSQASELDGRQRSATNAGGPFFLMVLLSSVLFPDRGKKSPREKSVIDQLELSEQKFRLITETIEDVFYLYNIPEARYEYISPHSERVMGAPPEFFYDGHSHTGEIVHPDDREKAFLATEKVNEGEAYDLEYRIVVGDEIRWVRERSFPISDEFGNIVRNSGICSDITEHKRILDELEQTFQNTSLLAQIGSDINQELTLDNVIQSIHDNVGQIMEAECFAVGVIDRDANEIYFPKFFENDIVFENIRYGLDSNVLATICATQDREIVIQDLETDVKRYSDLPLGYTEGESPSSVIYLPLKLENDVVGVITVQSFSKHAYTLSQVEILRGIGGYAANALANAKIHADVEDKVAQRTQELTAEKEKLRKSHEDIEQISKIGVRIASSLHFEDIFDEVHKRVSQLMPAEVFGIRLLHEEDGMVEYRYEIENGQRDEVIFVPMTDKDNYTVWCISNAEPIFINNNKEEYRNYTDEIIVVSGDMPDSLLFCPLIHNEKVIGAITVQSFEVGAYKPRHLTILQALATYTGTALSNANLYETLEAKVDERTAALREKNQEILDSINYAKRIQEAILPSPKERMNLLPDSFVLYLPKDIIGGDFYRVDRVRTNDNKEFVGFMVGDCTGHGVPGASLAILCSNILKQSTTEEAVNSPGQALDFARERVTTYFHDEGRRDIQDGMDVGFGIYDEETKALYYAGAVCDCLVVRNDELHLIRGDKMSIGLNLGIKPFMTQKFQLQSGDKVYLSSDGYSDQFGGTDNRKFMRKRLYETLMGLGDEPMVEHGKILEGHLNNWMDGYEQTDDICVLGFRVL